jgi:hypothetical protein
MVWKVSVMTLVTDWGFSKAQGSEKAAFHCEFVSRLDDRCYLFYKDPRWLFCYLFTYFNDRFPKHFVFANFQCLRCGELCGDEKDVYREDIRRWMIELRYDILCHVECWSKNDWCANLSELLEPCEDCSGGVIVNTSSSGRCPFVRKVRKRPYYECRIHGTSSEECNGYLCEKSVPISNLKFVDVEDLIDKIGPKRYKLLVKKSAHVRRG